MQTLANSQFITQMSDCQIHQVRHWLTYRHRSPKSCRLDLGLDKRQPSWKLHANNNIRQLLAHQKKKIKQKQTNKQSKGMQYLNGAWDQAFIVKAEVLFLFSFDDVTFDHLSLPYLSTTSAIWSVIVGELHLVYVRRFNRWMKHWWECAAGRAIQMACSVCYKDLTETLWRHQHIPFSSTIKMWSLFKFY